jgi:hypothetical protein
MSGFGRLRRLRRVTRRFAVIETEAVSLSDRPAWEFVGNAQLNRQHQRASAF